MKLGLPRCLPLIIEMKHYLFLALMAASSAKAQSSITARTGEATTLGVGYGLTQMSEADYATAAVVSRPNFVPMRVKPQGLSPQAVFGAEVKFGGFERSWALDPIPERGYRAYIDVNANGDLSDDEPIVLEDIPGKRTASGVLRAALVDTAGGLQTTYPFLREFVVRTFGERKIFAQRLRVLRRGTVRLSGRDVAFGLVGTGGLYGRSQDAVYFDLNGDGELDLSSESDAAAPPSPERHLADGGTVTISDTTYSITVDRYGRSLTLHRLTGGTARGPISVGRLAPDVTFTDASGRQRQLSEYRGRVVLLDFWSTTCGPCIAAMPKLVAAHAALRDRGFEILSVAVGDEPAAALAFAQERGLAWDHAVETTPGPLGLTYGVRALPRYFVIGRDGVLLASTLKGPDLVAEMSAFLN